MVYNITSPLTFLEGYCPLKKDNVMVLVCVEDNLNHDEKQGLAQNIRKKGNSPRHDSHDEKSNDESCELVNNPDKYKDDSQN
jgi:hypothetical protein